MSTMPTSESSRAAAAILDLLPGCLANDFGSWRAIVCAARNCGVDDDAICKWSLTDRYRDRHQVLRAIANFRSQAGLGTLLHHAREAGIDVPSLALPAATTAAALGSPRPARAENCLDRSLRVIDGSAALEGILRRSRSIADEVELWERSPYRLDWPGEKLVEGQLGYGEDAVRLLETLYLPDEHLFVGHRYQASAVNVAPVGEWLRKCTASGSRGLPGLELIQPNPHTGQPGVTQQGKPSWRCDNTVAEFRFAVVEFDSLPLGDQYAFWITMVDSGWPVAALVHSGGKSIHGWVRVDCVNRDEWEEQVERRLFGGYLKPLGVDGACRNESRLSRLPGHWRRDKMAWQRLLYLDPGAGKGGRR